VAFGVYYISPMYIHKILKITTLFTLLLGISIFAQSPRQNALILSSYSQKFEWAEQITKEMLGVLSKNNNLSIYTEYMDILKTPEQKYSSHKEQISAFYSMLESKYEDFKFNIVITVDYAAFDFVKQYRNDIFEGVPIVSCGVSYKQAKSVDSTNSLWSGIYKFYDVPMQVDFIKRMQNEIQRIVFITDNSETGQGIKEQLSPTISDINLEVWNEPMWESIPELLSYLDPSKDAVALTSINLNKSIENPQILWHTITKYIIDHSKAPVYSFWDIGVQNGVVGGNVIHAPLMGKNTGLLAAAVLAGQGSYIPGFQKTANIPMLDDNAAISRNLNYDKLPLGIIRLNKMDSYSWFVGKYQDYVSNMKNAIIAELAIILILGFAFYAYFKRSNEKLRLETESAKEANKAKSLFLANMSHEIRTPLNSMLGFSDLLLNKSENLSDEQREWCRSIEISSYHLRDTFNNIMDFSKIEAGALKIEEEWVDIFSLLDDLISVCGHYLLYKDIRFYIMPSIAMPRFIRMDPIKLKLVLVNLISNALKFTNKGSVKLIVNYKHDESGCVMYFEIIDTGIGIPKERLKKIFNAFEQLDTGSTKKYGGSGLGLSISQNILQAIGSNLDVISDKNGSSFHFQLSVKTKEEAFYTRFFSIGNQNVAIHNQDQKLLKYISECVTTVKGTATTSTNIEDILNLDGQDLLIAEGDRITDIQMQKIADKYPRVILVLYRENEKIEKIKSQFPQFECILSPIKSNDAIDALKKLYNNR
jgi:signal transduction histidine kinase